jgi:Tol biopolymer transport system component
MKSGQVRRAPRLAIVLPLLSVLGLLPATAVFAAPGDLTLRSTNAAGEKADFGIDDWQAADDGSFLAFNSYSTNLGYGNISAQVYVKNVATGGVVLASATAGGVPANGGVSVNAFGLSHNGRYVAFTTFSTNLSPNDLDANVDLYVKDLVTGELRLASTNAAGVKGNQTAITKPAISNDGQTVVFATNATNFDPAHQSYACTTGFPVPHPSTCIDSEAYAKHLDTGTLTLLSPVAPHTGGSIPFDISADGSIVAMQAEDALVPADTDGLRSDIYVLNLGTGSVKLASAPGPDGTPDGANIGAHFPRLSSDGSRVVFQAEGAAGALTSWDPRHTGFEPQVYLKDIASSALTLISVNGTGEIANHMSQDGAISGDGMQVSFASDADNLDPNDTDTVADIYLRDPSAGTTSLVTIGSDGVKANSYSYFSKPVPARDSVFFSTFADNLDDSGDPYYEDIFERAAPYGLSNPDADGDGVTDDVDADGGAGTSPAGAFSDDTGGGLVTSGQIVDAAGLTIAIADAADPDGVEITVGPGSGRIRLSVCGGFTIQVSAGSQVIVTCGSVTIKVVTGQATVVLDGGATTVSIPAGGAAKVTATGGTFSVANLGPSALTVTVDGVSATIPAGQTRTVAPWDFVGYSQPVDNLPVMNSVKAGQAIPLKWRVLGANGASVTNLTTATITVATLSCSLGTTVDQIEETVAAESGLQNLGNGYYQVNWKSPKTYGGSCKVLHLNINDGVTHDANFQFTK